MNIATDDEPDYESLDCFRCKAPMFIPEDSQQRLAVGWALDADGAVAFCPEHIPGRPHGWRDRVRTYSREELRGTVDPAKVPEQFRDLFE